MTADFQGAVLNRLTAVFDRPVIQNNFRGTYVEAMVAVLLGPGWRQKEDWAGWDFEHEAGTRLEVKQSAARQTWRREHASDSSGRFSIWEAKGYWDDDSIWYAQPGRPAQIYVFAWHGASGADCDHRKPSQWQFFVVPASMLPVGQATLGLVAVRRMTDPVGHADLAAAVERARREWLREAPSLQRGADPAILEEALK